jgi:p-aminobenzoyl-glutamate transporter AbgT
VSQLGIKQTAQENAARVLVPMLTEMGYKEENITIAFRKSLDIMKLINSNLEQK